jgi:hypothetical protein
VVGACPARRLGDEYIVSRAQLKAGFASSRMLAMSIWVDDETKALAEAIGAVTPLDKTTLTADLIY